MPTLRRLTGRCVFLRKGQVVCADTTAETIDRYLADVFEPADRDGVSRPLDFYRRGSVYDSSVRFQELRIASLEEGSGSSLRCGDSFRIDTVIQSERGAQPGMPLILVKQRAGRAGSPLFSPATPGTGFPSGLDSKPYPVRYGICHCPGSLHDNHRGESNGHDPGLRCPDRLPCTRRDSARPGFGKKSSGRSDLGVSFTGSRSIGKLTPKEQCNDDGCKSRSRKCGILLL